MADWYLHEAMGPLGYLKFKLRMWTRVSELPDWVMNNDPTYTEGRKLAIDADREYYEKEVWVGESVKYMMKWESVAQKDLDLVGRYAKIK